MSAERSIEHRYESGDYLDNNPTWHAEDAPWKVDQLAPLLKAAGADIDAVADVGCGTGAVLEALSKLLPGASDLRGYDISPQAMELAQGRATKRLSFQQGDFLEIGEPADLIIAMDVFEHVPDYVGFLRGLRPLAQWHAFHVPLDMNAIAVARDWPMNARTKSGHLHYFSKTTALATLTDCGYTVADAVYTESGTVPHGQSWSFGQRMFGRVRSRAARHFGDAGVRIFGGHSLMVLCGPSS